MKEKLITGIGATVLVAIMVFIAAVLTGTIIYLIYPIVVPIVVPSLVKNGHIPSELSWWVAVCFSWLWAILFKKSDTSDKK
jgi:hypothetical protein